MNLSTTNNAASQSDSFFSRSAGLKWKRGLLIGLLLLPGLGVIVGFISSVFVMAVSQSLGYFNFSGESGFTLNFWNQILGERQLWRSFFYSLKIASVSSFLAVLLAYPLALWLRKPFNGSLVISAILKAPLMVHGLVAAFLFVNVISFHGFFNEILVYLNIIDRPIRMQNDRAGVGVIILQIWKQMPFALLLLSGAVQTIGDDILEAACDLGAGALARFRKVILPLTIQAMQASMIIIFIGAAGDFSFQVIAGPTNVNSMAQYMVRMQEQANGWNLAAVVAILMMALALFGSLTMAAIARVLVRIGRN